MYNVHVYILYYVLSSCAQQLLIIIALYILYFSLFPCNIEETVLLSEIVEIFANLLSKMETSFSGKYYRHLHVNVPGLDEMRLINLTYSTCSSV